MPEESEIRALALRTYNNYLRSQRKPILQSNFVPPSDVSARDFSIYEQELIEASSSQGDSTYPKDVDVSGDDRDAAGQDYMENGLGQRPPIPDQVSEPLPTCLQQLYSFLLLVSLILFVPV